jgi:hypothetical protein
MTGGRLTRVANFTGFTVLASVTLGLLPQCCNGIITKSVTVGLGTVTLQISKSLGVDDSPDLCSSYTLKLHSCNYPVKAATNTLNQACTGRARGID